MNDIHTDEVVEHTSEKVIQHFDVNKIRADFPILRRKIHGKKLVFLDSAATAQKPESVISAEADFYRTKNANIHRGAYLLSEESSEAYEAVRSKVANFIGGVKPTGIVFTRNTTESINLVAHSWGRANIKPGDEIIVTEMEHHSNLVPWIQLAKATGAVLKHIPIREDSTLDMQAFHTLLSDKTKIVAVTLVSNVMGTINPVAEISEAAHEKNAIVVVDGAQAVPHIKVDVNALDCDFFAFSSHKMLGPTGVGVLYGKPHLLKNMDAFLGGGGMIEEVHLDHATWTGAPWRFEAGTPNVAGVVAFSAAIDYLENLGMDAVREHEKRIVEYALDKLLAMEDLKLFGPLDPERQAAVFTFYYSDIHPHDLSTILDRDGIAIRAGHHCAQPLMKKYEVPATVRASAYIYNDNDDIDALVDSLKNAKKYFHHEK